MTDFSDLVAQAIKPAMSREEREAVYGVVRQAVLRLREDVAEDDPRRAIQHHLVEETIRDVEADIARFEAMRKLDAAQAAQTRAHDDATTRGRR